MKLDLNETDFEEVRSCINTLLELLHKGKADVALLNAVKAVKSHVSDAGIHKHEFVYVATTEGPTDTEGYLVVVHRIPVDATMYYTEDLSLYVDRFGFIKCDSYCFSEEQVPSMVREYLSIVSAYYKNMADRYEKFVKNNNETRDSYLRRLDACAVDSVPMYFGAGVSMGTVYLSVADTTIEGK